MHQNHFSRPQIALSPHPPSAHGLPKQSWRTPAAVKQNRVDEDTIGIRPPTRSKRLTDRAAPKSSALCDNRMPLP